jgi:predicted GNAT family acetyltransferase
VGDTIVLPAGAPERRALEADGWTVEARSFGAELDASRIEQDRLETLVARSDDGLTIRELGTDDVHGVLALDLLTADDYPGSVATRHEPLDRSRATPTAERRAFGAITADGALVAMTFVDVDGTRAETDFTVVHGSWRGQGLGTAVKAASVLALAAAGVARFRTGGSLENTGILRANDALGYVRDEEWVTLRGPAS